MPPRDDAARRRGDEARGRRLVLQMQCSLDGFVGGPDGELDWIFPDFDAQFAAWMVDALERAGAHLMGASTYRDMAAYWPTSTEPYAAPMNRIPKVVFSRSLAQADWGPVRIASGALADEVARLKREEGGELLAHGGARFAQSLVRAGLVDEYRLLVHPVALGAGLRLFPEGAPPLRLKVEDRLPFASGLTALTLAPA